MALIAHQTQVSFASHDLRSKALSNRAKWKSSKFLQVIYRIDDFAPLKLKFRCQPQPFCLPKRKSFKVSSFKGDTKNDEPEGKGGVKSSKSSIHISHGQGRNETLSESYDAKDNSLSYGSEEKEESTMKSLAIKRLFLKWLLILRTQSSNHTKDENYTEETPKNTSLEAQEVSLETKEANMLKTALAFFLGLDAAISIPLLLFVPGFLTVRVVHGATVTKELMPMWLLGPFIIALYVKIIQGLCWLYVFLFMQSINLVKNLPAYSLLVYSYIAEGKLKGLLWTIFCKPFVDVRNLDYGAFIKQKYKQLEVWAIEKYLDYVESIWPYYCRTIRFLKKAHLL